MTIAVLEISALALRLWRDGELLVESPACAVLNDREPHLGHAAEKIACQHPTTTHRGFWEDLNQAPLAGTPKTIRHNADLAYLHLQSVLKASKKPEELVIAVPSEYDSDQLGLVVGLNEACGVKVAGMVDNATACVASSCAPGHYDVIELGWARSTISRVEVDEDVTRTKVDVVESAGALHAYAALMEAIASAFLDQSRFDPLHDGSAEQRLNDQLGTWLEHAAKREEVELELPWHGNHFQAKIKSAALAGACAQYLDAIAGKVSNKAALLTQRTAGIPGWRNHLSLLETISADSAYKSIATNRLLFHDKKGGVTYTFKLPRNENPSLTLADPGRQPREADVTHFLLETQAYAVGNSPLYISNDGKVSAVQSGDSIGEISRRADRVRLRGFDEHLTVNGQAIDGYQEIIPGDRIAWGMQFALLALTAVDPYAA
ncbi:MAG: hypothetical protein AAF384_17355 [Pseudomonadota bacterium]